MVDYNRTRTVQQLLAKTASAPPSFTIHLHLEYWVLNNGSKFAYHNQIASLLDDISNCRIPVDFLELFDQAHVPYYDGCMVVELLDYRPETSRDAPLRVPIKSRVVLHPNAETLWADICSVNQRLGGTMTDNDALELESKILLATAPPLCLDPDPHLTRIVNSVIRASTPGVPVSLKRKARALEPEDDGPEKAKRERFLSFMAPRDNRSHAPSYRLLDATVAKRKADATAPPPANGGIAQPPPPSMLPQAPRAATPASATTPVDKKKKGDTPQIPAYNVAFTRSDGTHTPVPPRPTHQFVNQHPPPANGAAPVPAQGHPGFQVPTEAAKRTPTPAQMTHQQQQLMQQQRAMQAQQQLIQQQAQAQAAQQGQPRPPSQPQIPQPQNLQGQPQRFTQSPKPPQPIAASPSNQQPQPQNYGTPKQFPNSLPNHNFLQQPPPPGVRPGQIKPPGPNVASQAQPQGTTAQQLAAAQQLYIQQQRAMAQQQQAAAAAGRITPQMQAQMQGNQPPQQHQQPQPPQPPPQHAMGGAGSPSPVRASPMVTNQSLQQANIVRSSPIPGKNQIAGQPGVQQGPAQHPTQQLTPHQQQTLAQMQHAGFQPPFTPHMRPGVVHGGNQSSPAMSTAVSNGTPSLAASVVPSPRLSGNARPITPAVSNGVGAGGMPPPPQPAQTPQMSGMQLPGQQGGAQQGQPGPGPTRQAATPLQRAQFMNAMAAQQRQLQAAQQAQAGQAQAQQQQQQHSQMASLQAALHQRQLQQQQQQQQQQQAAQGGNANMGGMNIGMNASAGGAQGQGQGLPVPPNFQGTPAQYQLMVQMAMHKNMQQNSAQQQNNIPNGMSQQQMQQFAMRLRVQQQHQARMQAQQQQQQQHQEGMAGGVGGGMGGTMGAGGMGGMGAANMSMGGGQAGQGAGPGAGQQTVMVNGRQMTQQQFLYLRQQQLMAAQANGGQQFNHLTPQQQQQQNQAFLQLAQAQAMKNSMMQGKR